MLYPQENALRELRLLDGFWDFQVDPDEVGEERGWFRSLPDPEPMAVPSSYNELVARPELRDFLGSVWYFRRFFVPASWAGKRIWLRFGAVNYRAAVFVNGQKLTEWEGGHLPFAVEATSLVRAGEENALAVKVNNLLDWTTVPPGRVIRPPELGGHGFDAQWNDDFHHALHALLTGERAGYYRDYGRVEHLARAWRGGYVYTGQYSRYRRRRHGDTPGGCPAHRFVVFAQNHDQVGNRAFGERLSVLVSPEGLKVAAAAVLLSPFVPLLFMGEEYGETAPFLYFTDHADPRLAAAVREGRRKEYPELARAGNVLDPQDEASFSRSRLRWELRERGHHRVLLELYRALITLRRELPALAQPDWEHAEVRAYEDAGVMFVHQRQGNDEVCLVFSFGDAAAEVSLPVPAGRWEKRLDTAETRWLGEGSPVPPVMRSRGTVSLALGPRACVVFAKTGEE